MRSYLISAILTILIFSCTPEINNFESVVTEFETQLRQDLQEDNIDGSISAAIIKDNKIRWSKTFGYSDRVTKSIADTSTIYRTGSISKSFTAFLMMQLVEEKLIKLSDPIELYLPEVKSLRGYSDSTKITFLQLSTHVSGLIREPALEDAASGLLENWENKILQSIPQTSFDSKPGEKFSYSNIGYGILGLALSRAAKKPFTELIIEKICVPLKMKNSYFKVPAEVTSQLATGINGGPGEIDMETPDIEHAGRGYKVPNGGIYSTPNDLAKFAIANMGYTTLLSEKSLESMQTGEVSQLDNYGVGFFINENQAIKIINHGGSVAGYTAQFAFESTSKYGVIIMRNYNFGATDLTTQSYSLLMALKELNPGNNKSNH